MALLSQHLSAAEWAGVGCVVAASAGAAATARAADRGSQRQAAGLPGPAQNGALA
jgi:threonine/homoserine efflux transporter RhtA